jgi:hypothetical protein
MTSAELLAKVDEGWQAFREEVRSIGRAMDEPTGGGWTYRDLIAHFAAWQDLTARRLRRMRETGTYPGAADPALGVQPFKNDDEFNARVTAGHRLVGAEALLDELDAAYRAVRTEIAKLTDDQINANDGFAVAIVRGNTWGHYEEHAAELGR